MMVVFVFALCLWLLFRVSKAMAFLGLLALIVFSPVKTVIVILILIALISFL